MYYIDLTATNPKITKYNREDLEADLEDHGAKSWRELSDYDFKVFQLLEDATNWLNRYLSVKNKLNNATIKKTSDAHHMLYKRRYIVQSLMGEKNQTYRHYKVDLNKGDLLNLHDQTYFLTVKITNVTKEKNQWKYEFEVLNP